MVVSEKAEIVEANLERRFRSERAEYPYPLVIRLVKFVEIPRRLRKHVTNAILFARDTYRCQYCSKHRDELNRKERLTRDHVKPLSRGGTNSWDNVVTACTKCNARKGNRLPMECGMYPKSTPKEPRYVVRTGFQLLVISKIIIRPEASRARLRREPKSRSHSVRHRRP